MKKYILVAVVFTVFGCAQDNILSTKKQATGGNQLNGSPSEIQKVVFTDLFAGNAVTTMGFDYNSSGKIQTVAWAFQYQSMESNNSFSEKRFYSGDGDLAAIETSGLDGGSWKISYEYKDGHRYKVSSKRNNSISTTTFAAYDDVRPLRVENLYGVYGLSEFLPNYARYTEFVFDANDNLVSQKNTGIPGYDNAREEKTTTYGTEINPLRNLIETPLPQAIEYYDDVAFHYSTHLPVSVDANYPYVNPIYNRVAFRYGKDNSGRVTQINAFSPDRNAACYKIDISYRD